MSYPDEIIVVKGSPEYKVLSHSEFFKTLAENWSKNNEVTLTSEFFGDKWPMFVDLFFPEIGYNPLFMFKNGSIQVIPKRGTKEDLAKLMDFLLVDDEKTMMNFARNQARKQLNAPAITVNRGKGTRRNGTHERKRGNNNNNNYYNNYNNNYNNNNNNSNNENNENNGPNIGFANNNEEAIYGKLSNKNAKKYFPNIGRQNRTRRIKN
jgi:hypothetical protein